MPIARDSEGAALLSIKAVPGAKRDEVVGPLGERLKVRVAAAPEGGKANEAICRLLAGELGLKAAAVTVVRGHGSAEEAVRVEGVAAAALNTRWAGG